ncbi:hypothetical protein PPSIR1_18035 [Plesiocystis pacifica SIR-1]|uniref:Uncharacterized protein n=1 Tax=Plesiocystis pacifica SIR-1 TaxID=391625 RepID=A6GFU7_9BACT|nr:hypothetical protein [Plesiocystis pacifica]EDM75245.1 hypothetical protein PPSIR1_18035 [Plesiocystis pacifica SIR-1]
MIDRVAKLVLRTTKRKAMGWSFHDGRFGQPLDEARGPFGEALELARWAPSAKNEQPWRAVVRPDGRGVDLYVELGLRHQVGVGRKMYACNPEYLDLGTFIRGLDVGLAARGVRGRWRAEDPGLAWPGPPDGGRPRVPDQLRARPLASPRPGYHRAMPRSSLVVLVALSALACGRAPLSGDEGDDAATDGESGEDEASTDSDTSESESEDTSSETDTADTDSSETGAEPEPLSGDNCDVELRWAHVAEGGDPEDVLRRLAVHDGLAVLGGEHVDGEDRAQLVVAVDAPSAQTRWQTSWADPFVSFEDAPGIQGVADVRVDAGRVFALGASPDIDGGVPTWFSVHDPNGESLALTTTQDAQWRRLTRDGDRLLVVGLHRDGPRDDLYQALAWFDDQGQLDELVEAEPAALWIDDVIADAGRIWFAGKQFGCGFIGEYAPDGALLWSTCVDAVEDEDIGALTALSTLPDAEGTLVAVGGVDAVKEHPERGAWLFTEPHLSAWTREGQPAFDWTPGPGSFQTGQFDDLAVLPDGGFVAVSTERDVTTPEDPSTPVLYRFDGAGALLTRCELSRGAGWSAALPAVEVDGDRVVALLVGAVGDEPAVSDHALVEIEF